MLLQNQLTNRQRPAVQNRKDLAVTSGQKILYWLGCALMHQVAKMQLAMDIHQHAPLPAGPKIFAANHPTTVDPFLLLTLAPEQMSILVTGDLFKTPLFGRYLRAAGHIPVLRENGWAAFVEARARLQAGRNIGIFPEGALSPLDGDIDFGRPRTGAARLALSSGAPIIPVGIYLPQERIRFIDCKMNGNAAVARLYLHGAYAVTIGEPLVLTGDEQGRERVRFGSELIMARIAGLSQESKLRLQMANPVESTATLVASN